MNKNETVVVFNLGYCDENCFIQDYLYTHDVGVFENGSEACYYMDTIRERCFNYQIPFVANPSGQLNYSKIDEKLVYILFSAVNIYTGEIIMEIGIDLSLAKRIGSINALIKKSREMK